ncbi:branched-chain amino acid ABC transporter permease [Treponema phagedenis]|uniref:Branched-chain amino acid ABC transporter permease n=1 Tax=Treponema phagedenis TaxID=162 RepID=A0A0B7GWK1_TREPH|nr:branched-chain amino acid ABC transporter permease [Treponema phagedenis]NVP23323.1 branched-chain amino acid ABC transporter permease [Treponema phagedenis]QEJ95538.1 branched-chain amino acid ABC transporter permease [Treponema phagedenis]QEJ98432.1 branched-chain amino acid ABC transporter permease [Treponema phagedenis]QEK01393.1 branched-chain amino acid ABC transporter permease [Treponema phagedenis]QEK03940.1 branched-chain amino acid ABC transporter permease [Treponema phagedenis]
MSLVHKKYRSIGLSIAALLVLVVMPGFFIKNGIIDPYTAQILTLAAINAIAAISVNIICGLTGQLSLGQAGFMAIGAYFLIWFYETCAIPLPAAIVAAALVAAVAGFVIGFPVLQLTGDYLAIVTLGFGEIIRVVFTNFKSFTGGPNGKRITSILTVMPEYAWFAIASVLALVIIVLYNGMKSPYGRAVLAVREDEIAANSCGISVFRYKMGSFIFAAFVAGLAGALYAPFLGFVKPDIASFNKSVDFLIFVVLGGIGNITGSIIAAFVLTYLQELLRFLQEFRLLIYPMLLIIVMLFRPQGLLGSKELSFSAAAQKLQGLFGKKQAEREDA